MPTAFEMYKAQVAELPPLEDTWFGEALAKARSGDDDACRKICGSCLDIPLHIAERMWRKYCLVEILDLVQEGNAALLKSVRQFTGSSATEFRNFATRSVEKRITWILDNPFRYLGPGEAWKKRLQEMGHD